MKNSLAEILNNVVKLLEDQVHHVNTLPAQQHDTTLFMTEDELFHSLFIHYEQPTRDVGKILKLLNEFEASSQAQAQELLSCNEFTWWMESAHPKSLFVLGNFWLPGSSMISPLSILCATLALSLHMNARSIVLHFFCGLHQHGNDPVGGPTGLIQSLIAQLILSGSQFDMSFINTHSFKDDIRSHSLKELCSTFRELIEQLPPTVTVICMLDSITSFESKTWEAQWVDVINILDNIVRNERLRPIFKIIITTSFMRSGFTGDRMKIDHLVRLQPNVVGGERMSIGVTPRPWRSMEGYRQRMARADESDDDSDY
ncbi:hypothetical protein BDV38DRAFT_276782 [Aspergillus pseudotamarii]|uniref:Nephrocystin 3-like N-terminal domain-containing protein n=1 Tax=Aspergillus pseudotamarii TaxID=132259 RepID=A0A5N6TBP9_ASPPS|nr:uncharacterized protein BDV38DRAFT_276782 [Aspergillus pseudotamarii]KAE8143700.1 hypothetical protein BDV38DRAFT_276782 [Aspergillus pseudotamarii]